MRAATTGKASNCSRAHFNPRCPCGQRQHLSKEDYLVIKISIHAAHAGSDCMHDQQAIVLDNFNPRCPCGQRPPLNYFFKVDSIFQSTLPMRAATQHFPYKHRYTSTFQSTLPMRAATKAIPLFVHGVLFQSTLPMRAATPLFVLFNKEADNFNPRCPCGQRPLINNARKNYQIFQSTLPMRAATGKKNKN